jgi:hypothetical protein
VGTETATGLLQLRTSHPDLTGEGVNIAMIDSGVAYYLSTMGTCSAVNTSSTDGGDCRVVQGYDFVGKWPRL